MKLEAGKKYVLVSGQVVGPVWDIGDGTFKAMDRVDGFRPCGIQMGHLISFLTLLTTTLPTGLSKSLTDQ